MTFTAQSRNMPLVERLRSYKSNAGYAKYAKQAAALLEVRQGLIERLTEHNTQMALEIVELRQDQAHKVEHIQVLSDQVNEQHLRAQERIRELEMEGAIHERTIREQKQFIVRLQDSIESLLYERGIDRKCIDSLTDELIGYRTAGFFKRIKQWWEDRQ